MYEFFVVTAKNGRQYKGPYFMSSSRKRTLLRGFPDCPSVKQTAEAK